MTLTMRVLGCDSPYPRPGRPCSGYLVDASGTLVLMEVGFAVWPALLQHVEPNDVTAIWISHLHPDHCADLFAAYQWAGNTADASRIIVYGPTGWAERLGAALPSDDGAASLRRVFDVREHTIEPQYVGDVELLALPVQHSAPTYGLRLAHRGSVLAYSGDSGTCPTLTTVAADSDLFLCEAGAVEPGQPFHCAPEEAATLGQTAGRLVLTHLAPTLNPAQASRRAGGATIAHPGMSIDVTAPG